LEPVFNIHLPADPGNGIVGRGPEKIHPDDKKYGIDDAGDYYPPEETVLLNKAVRFRPGLYGDSDFFKQRSLIWVNIIIKVIELATNYTNCTNYTSEFL